MKIDTIRHLFLVFIFHRHGRFVYHLGFVQTD